MALPILPDVPLNLDPVTTSYLNELTTALNEIIETFSPPGIVSEITVEATTLAIRISWTSAKNATQYRVLRSLDGDITTAQIIATVPASKTGVATLSMQDVEDVDSDNRYYWIQGINERGVLGPLSKMVSTDQDAQTGPYKDTVELYGYGDSNKPTQRWNQGGGSGSIGEIGWARISDAFSILCPDEKRLTVEGGDAYLSLFGGNLFLNANEVVTTTTTGFAMIPWMEGTPTGAIAPSVSLLGTAIVVDSTNNRLYLHYNGGWHYATLT